jgi:hypothetical protein
VKVTFPVILLHHRSSKSSTRLIASRNFGFNLQNLLLCLNKLRADMFSCPLTPSAAEASL